MTTRANSKAAARTLGHFDPGHNSINTLRLILAVLVIVSQA